MIQSFCLFFSASLDKVSYVFSHADTGSGLILKLFRTLYIQEIFVLYYNFIFWCLMSLNGFTAESDERQGYFVSYPYDQ